MLTDAPSNAFCKNFLFEGQTHTYRGRDLPSASSLPIPTVARAGPGHSQEPGSHSSFLMKVAGVQVLEPSFAASRGGTFIEKEGETDRDVPSAGFLPR